MATIIRTNGKKEEVKPANGVDFQLKELYFLLNCRLVETFNLADGRLMICDEESKLVDDWEVNLEATELYRVNRMDNKEIKEYFQELKKEGVFVIDAREDTFNCIAGDVLICEQHEFL